MSNRVTIGCICLLLMMTACGPKWEESGTGAIRIVVNEEGPTLGYAVASGISIITVDRYGFKDLNKNGMLDPYEDWRLRPDERARDLASRMSVEQIAGLMLYSGHQAIPGGGFGPNSGMYGGKLYAESGAAASDLTDQQKEFLTDDNVRHVLITRVESPEVAATWNNNAQALVEGLGLGIPINTSSDPRHASRPDAEYNAGAGGEISMWPGSLGLAATFDPEVTRGFGDIASKEYRALGIATSLSPQVDLATEPRWNRFNGTFGESPHLAAAMAAAYIDGFQRSSDGGWGNESVNAMVKHWPGGGPEEGGRDAHWGYGKYAVYPGGNFSEHLIPFTQGAFKLSGGTGMASAVMPYYTISWGQDSKTGENVGNAYSAYLITDLLRGEYQYDGVVCTDWLVTANADAVDVFQGKPWGVEGLSVAERHYKVIMAGVDQFGGNNDAGPVLEAYRLGVAEHGEDSTRARFETSAVRLLRNIFRTGLFENPYLDPAVSGEVVGNAEFMRAGFEAQLKSVVMLKNQGGVLPIEKNKTVYIPKRLVPERRNFFGNVTPASLEDPVDSALVARYFTRTTEPDEADFAVVFIESPESGGGYDRADLQRGGNGYVPISLQYGPYRAAYARDSSIAGGDPHENFINRSYKGKSVTTANAADLRSILDTQKAMKGKPVIVSLRMSNPTVMGEFEKSANAILVNFGVQPQAVFEILTGAAEPSALLPMQLPVSMQTVEEQAEDVPFDMSVYIDAAGNRYDFGFGLNWSGVIADGRKEEFKR